MDLGIRVLAGCLLAAICSVSAMDIKEGDMDKLVGQPADIAPSAYQYRADRKPEDNPPEVEFLFSALTHKKPGVICGLLWEETRLAHGDCQSRSNRVRWSSAPSNFKP